MAKMSFGSRGGRVRRRTTGTADGRSPEEVVRELKAERRERDEGYRERSLAIHGPVCARCGREFDHRNRHLLTVHHRDGNHHNNPPDGSNWENLCVYCHDDVHSREVLGEHVAGARAEDRETVYEDPAEDGGAGCGLGALLKEALEKKGR